MAADDQGTFHSDDLGTFLDDVDSAIQDAVEEKLARLDRTRLIRESAKLDPEIEQKLADEGLAEDFEEWPEY